MSSIKLARILLEHTKSILEDIYRNEQYEYTPEDIERRAHEVATMANVLMLVMNNSNKSTREWDAVYAIWHELCNISLKLYADAERN